MRKISVIIPFYNGNSHLLHLKKILESNQSSLGSMERLEVILVNDSPWIDINVKEIESTHYDLVIVTHKENGGIHKARVTGIENATGQYIVFLDQDDEVADCYFLKMLKEIESSNKECIIANGIYETDKGAKVILDSYGKVKAALDVRSYYIVGNMLCSPGQCIIRREAVPEFWKKHIMKTNCSDDLFLWCVMFNNNRPGYCNELLYTHINTGVNFSLDKENGYLSDAEMIDLLEQNENTSRVLLNIFKLRNSYNIQKMNRKITSPIRYYVYAAIMNGYKCFIKFSGYLYKFRGYTVPKIKQ